MPVVATEIVLLCCKVFLCRIIDVSLSTFRTVILVKGKTKIAAIIAVVEALIWFLVVREALNYETSSAFESFIIANAYALGFACGNIIGGELSKKISETINVQVVTSSRNNDMVKKIQEEGYAVTVMDGEASQFSGEKYIIFAAIDSSKLKSFKKLVYELDNKAFIMVSETKIINHAIVK